MNAERAFLLPAIERDQSERAHAIEAVAHALEELSHKKGWRLTVEEARPERSLLQNRYLFGVAYKLLSEHTGYEKDDLHLYLLGKHFGVRLKRVPRSKYNAQGLIEIPVRTTTTDGRGHRHVLSPAEFSDYVDFVKRFAAETVNVMVPDPDPAYRIYLEHDRRAA